MFLHVASALLFPTVSSRAAYPPGCGDATYPNDKECEAKNWYLGPNARDTCAPYGPYPVNGQQVYIEDALNFCINLPDPNSPYLKANYYSKGLKPTVLQAEGYVQSFCLGNYQTPGAFAMPLGGIKSAHVKTGMTKNGKSYIEIYGQLDCTALGINCVGTAPGAFDSSGQYDTAPFINCGKAPYSGVDQSKNPGKPDYNMQAGDYIFCQRICEPGQQLDDPCNVKSDTAGCFKTMGITPSEMYAAGFDVYNAATGVKTVLPLPSTSLTVSTDGKCGANQKACSTAQPCCSEYGWCGSTSSHCGAGCQAAFSLNRQCSAGSSPPAPPPASTPRKPGTPSPDGTCGSVNGFTCTSSLPCCSQYGWCGSTSSHCGAGSQTTFAFGGNADVTVPGLSGQISSTSTDGSCGVSRGLCPQSTPCCSQYGWCGSTDAYCGLGKQSDYSFGGIGPGIRVADWETCQPGDSCISSGFTCCAAPSDIGPPIKYTCRLNDCARLPASRQVLTQDTSAENISDPKSSGDLGLNAIEGILIGAVGAVAILV